MKSDRKKLKDKAWKLMSEFIRRRDKGKCFTCPKQDDWKYMQAGHFVHKDCMDFNEININCQCPQCNKWKHGNLGIYAIRLDQKYGVGTAETLIQQGQQLKPYKSGELIEKIETLKEKLKMLDNGK